MKKVEFLGLVKITEVEGGLQTGVRAIDNNGKKFTKISYGRTTNKKHRIRFSDIIREFKHDDIVKITFQKVEKSLPLLSDSVDNKVKK